MSIYPIAPQGNKLKCFALLGHSNADGWAASDFFFSSPTIHLYPHAGPFSKTAPSLAYWKNVYVATSAQPFPEADNTPAPATTPGDVAWLEMTVANKLDPSDPHPHESPFDYPNVRGSCYPRWLYNSYPTLGSFTYFNDSPGSHNGTLCGVEVPFSWHWKHYWQDQVGVVKVAFSSSYFMALEYGAGAEWLDPSFRTSQGTPEPVSTATPLDTDFVRSAAAYDGGEYNYYGYWTPFDNFDWAPSTDRLYGLWYRKMVGAAAALPEGVQMDVQCVIAWFGDNEAAGRSLQALRTGFKQACVNFIRRIRHDLVVNEWTTLAESQIPVVWPKIQSGYNNANVIASDGVLTVDFCNAILEEIAADDPFLRLVEVEDWATMADDGYNTLLGIPGAGNHYGHTGYTQAAQDIFDAWLEMREQAWDAIAEEDRVTVEEVRDHVRTYYNRSRTQTDIDDETFLIHCNGALNRILNDVGDNAYWLRVREEMDLDVGPNNETTLSKKVARVLKIENPQRSTEGLKFQLMGHGDGGKCKIQLLEGSSGSYVVNYIRRPRNLTVDDELVPIPRTIIEWLVVETTRRLARSGTNITLQASLEGEARELRDRCIKELQVQQRAKNDRLHTVRRWPRLSYRRRTRPWDSG